MAPLSFATSIPTGPPSRRRSSRTLRDVQSREAGSPASAAESCTLPTSRSVPGARTMRAVRRLAVVLLLVTACGVRTPARIDLTARIQARGAEQVRRELVVRVLDDPRDVQARLALAELAEQMKRPSEAIEQLEAVLRLGGPIGTRWDDEDRVRLGRLLLARGRVRLARGAASALRDLERAGSFGAPATKDELVGAQIAIAIANIKHVAVKERAQGRAVLAKHARLAPVRSGADPAGAPSADAVLPEEAAWL